MPAHLCAGEIVTSSDFDFGPLITKDVSFQGNTRIRILGPLWEHQLSADEQRFSALRPLYARTSETNSPRILKELLWPFATLKVYRNESYYRVVTAFGHDYELDAESRYKNHIFPIVFQGRSADGHNYFALFPLGGTIREFMGRDRVDFALFPLYGRSQVNEFVTHDVLWPFISWSRHDEGSRWRVFPFYGQAQHDGHWKRRFVMWPILTSINFEKADGGGFILFPVTGYSRIEQERTFWLAPPLFKWLESPERRAVNCPWPFFQYETGNQEKLYIWPIWGKRKKGVSESSFLLWPVFHSSKTEFETKTRSSFRALPFVYTDKTVEKPEEDGEDGVVSKRYFKLWPLLSYRRDGNCDRLRSLELWPMRNTGPIERNFAPLWTIYSRERDGDSFDTELLWGLYRNRRGQKGERAFSVFPLYSQKRKADPMELSSWRILAGLFGREVEDGVRRWRVLYFLRFGNKKVTK